MEWKRLGQKPRDDKNYLVCYLTAEGYYSAAHRAYYIEEENKFYSLENNNSHPIVVDIFIEMPDVPNDKI